MVKSSDIKKLLSEQLREWELAKTNFEALNHVKTKVFDFDDFIIKVQFNPARIQSSAAKIDQKSIKERKCFLCSSNLPSEQRGLAYNNNYTVLVNPFPIFDEHFTIPSDNHEDQLILDRFVDMLDQAKDFDDYILFYNGPKCGASAPDHIHFQAGNKGFLPIEKESKSGNKEIVIDTKDLKIYALKNNLRNSILLVSDSKEKIANAFNFLYSILDIKDGEKEPMLNLLTWFEDNKWYSLIIPREKHRPSCFFEEGDKNILISPASVDMGGVLITPQEKDFEKITKQDIEHIFKEVCISENKLDEIISKLKDFKP